MPSRLRPTASYATDAILVGDPGRALLLAQELHVQPKMSNHARGLWGYSGITPGGDELTIQSTGMGGPSAALVLADLAELGVRRAVRVGSCAANAGEPGELILVERAVAGIGSALAFGLAPGEGIDPDAGLTTALRDVLNGEGRSATVTSSDAPVAVGEQTGEGVADMQTVAVLARARALGIATAAVLVVVETGASRTIPEELRVESEKRAGRAVSQVLSSSS